MSDFRFSHIGIAEDSSPLEYNTVIWWVSSSLCFEGTLCLYLGSQAGQKHPCSASLKVWEITAHWQCQISSDLKIQYYITSFYQMATEDSLVKNCILIHFWCICITGSGKTILVYHMWGSLVTPDKNSLRSDLQNKLGGERFCCSSLHESKPQALVKIGHRNKKCKTTNH